MKSRTKQLLATLVVCTFSWLVQAQGTQPYCGDQGVWIQILGSGELSLDSNRSMASYLVWVDNKARVLVDAGSGTTLRYSESGADFRDLAVILTTQSTIDHTGDLPSFIAASKESERSQILPIFGPVGGAGYPSILDLFDRLMGPSGAYPQLANMLSYDNPAGYRVRVREIPATGHKRWAGFGTGEFSVSAIPVNHDDVPTLAWRIDIGKKSLVFGNDFNNQKDILAKFAEGADIIVFTHALPAGTRGSSLKKYVTPTQIGRIAKRAGVRFIVLGNRGWRTFGREEMTMQAIEEHFEGTQIYANELECWGL